jgi:hypothetical protein
MMRARSDAGNFGDDAVLPGRADRVAAPPARPATTPLDPLIAALARAADRKDPVIVPRHRPGSAG